MAAPGNCWRARPRRGLMRLNRMLLEQLFSGLLARHYLSNLVDDDFQTYRTSLMVEASTRLALSFSCFAFVLLGAALGIRIHRRESSIGMALSLVLVFIFYFFAPSSPIRWSAITILPALDRLVPLCHFRSARVHTAAPPRPA